MVDRIGSFSVAVVMACILLSLKAMKFTWRSKGMISCAVLDGSLSEQKATSLCLAHTLLLNHKIAISVTLFEGGKWMQQGS